MEEKSNLPRPVFGVLGASAWQWPTGLSLLASPPLSRLWGKGTRCPHRTSHCHCVQQGPAVPGSLHRASHLSWISQCSIQAARGEKDAPFLTSGGKYESGIQEMLGSNCVFSPTCTTAPLPTPSPPHGTREAGFVCFPWRM